MSGLTLSLPPEAIEQIAIRAAEIVSGGGDSPPPETTGYLDVAGAAGFLACKPARIYALVSANRIPHHRDGSRLLFDRQELRAYVLAGGAKRP